MEFKKCSVSGYSMLDAGRTFLPFFTHPRDLCEIHFIIPPLHHSLPLSVSSVISVVYQFNS